MSLLAQKLKYMFKRKLEKYPYIFVKTAFWFNKIKGNNTDRIATKDSDVCIEGFPRCANSFARSAFQMAQPNELKIATHLHSSANVIAAIRLGIPTMVLIRKPENCIISLRALEIEVEKREGKKGARMPIKHDIIWYISFYQALIPFKHKIVIAKFDDVTKDFGRIIHAMNEKYKTSFLIFKHEDKNQKKIFKKENFHLSPSQDREAIKVQVKKEFYTESNAMLIKKAQKVYEEFVSN